MFSNQKVKIFLLIFVCTFFQILPVIRSGLKYSYGTAFWGPNGHDAVWHLSLINNIKNPLKIALPTMSGEYLTNYHPFYDILVKYTSSLTHIPTNYLVFQIFPLLMSFSFLYLSYLIGGPTLVCLNTFATSLGPLIGRGETAFWSMQSASNQLNPPFMLSLVFLSYLIYLIYKKKKLNFFDYFISFLLLVLLPITKAYSAPIAFFLFFVFTLKNLKNNKKPLVTLLFGFVFATILFFVYNPKSAGIFEYQPFWFINSMFNSPDRLYFAKFAGLYGWRLFVFQIFGVFVFIFGNFAFRLFGILKAQKEFLFLIILNTLIPLFIVQKGTAWNTIQFLYYALFLGNILLANYLTNKKYLTIFIVLISLFANSLIYKNYLGNPAPSAIPQEEISALNFLKQLPVGNILVHPFDPYLRNRFSKTPLPLFVYETTAYVSAFAQKPVFLEDEMNLNILNKNIKLRRQEADSFFLQKNIYQDRGFLVNNQIDYIYLNQLFGDNLSKNSLQLGINKIFENNDILIFKVQR